jgi:hypothetical protein
MITLNFVLTLVSVLFDTPITYKDVKHITLFYLLFAL